MRLNKTRLLLRLLLGSAVVSLFDSDGHWKPPDPFDAQAALDKDARLRVIQAIGSGELPLAFAQDLYGKNLENVTAQSLIDNGINITGFPVPE